MEFEERLTGSYGHQYRIGDKVQWYSHRDEKTLTLTVGDDWGELYKWTGINGDNSHIVTTCGRVLHIDELNK